MGYTYTPTYYSGLQDTIASLCKSILPFGGFRSGRRLTADQAAARRHADALKWQQDSFHRILHLSALHREGIVPPSDVDAFRANMLATLAAAPPPPAHPDQPAILRDKLLFLQVVPRSSSSTSLHSSESSSDRTLLPSLLLELLYAKCISTAEYNSTKRPLVQRLAAFGVVVDCPDADVGDGGAAAARRHQPRRRPWRSGRRSTSGTRPPPRRPPTSRSTRPSSRHGRAEARRSWTHRGHR